MAVSDPGHISCVANDYGYEKIFSRSVEAWLKKGDVLLAISTSGRSKNVVEAVRTARSKEVTTIALLGGDGGELKKISDIPIIVPLEPHRADSGNTHQNHTHSHRGYRTRNIS